MRSIAVAIYAAGMAVASAFLTVKQSELIQAGAEQSEYYMVWLNKQYMFGAWAAATLLLLALIFIERNRPSKNVRGTGDTE